jgi:hypothetical protein
MDRNMKNKMKSIYDQNRVPGLKNAVQARNYLLQYHKTNMKYVFPELCYSAVDETQAFTVDHGDVKCRNEVAVCSLQRSSVHFCFT